MASINEIFSGKKKLLVFALVGVVLAVGAYFLLGSKAEVGVEGDAFSQKMREQDDTRVTEAEQLIKNMKAHLSFFENSGVADYFDKHDLIIPVEVDLSELSVDNPFEFVEQKIVFEEAEAVPLEIVQE